ncbi:MAG: NTP transferase domain-containing protein [Caulobacter sp.]|nr:NTP transferase domain-containing protein [Caulobacter sp.]
MQDGRGLGIDALVLAGGLGTRLKDVLHGKPKVLAPVGGKPFLDHLLAWLARAGTARVVLALGHLADRVKDHLAAAEPPLPVTVVVEDRPLGTAGAVAHARPALRGEPVLVMNGDTWFDADLNAFLDDFRASGAAFSILCVEVPDGARYGRVSVDANGFVTGFAEKDPTARGTALISAGTYLLSAAALDRIAAAEGPSLERDVLERLPAGTVRAWCPGAARFVDIGTPDSLATAPRVMAGAKGERAPE